MIDKNKTVNGVENVVFINFDGTVGICALSTNLGTILTFKNCPDTKVKIGEQMEDKFAFRTIEELKPDMIFHFKKTESIDAIIGELRKCKKYLKQNKE